MPFFMVQHNITNPDLYKANVEPMIATLPNMDPVNDDLHKQNLHQLSIQFVPSAQGQHVGWCIFESKPGSKWNVDTIKAWQDKDKEGWAVQDVYEINQPTGHTAYYKRQQ